MSGPSIRRPPEIGVREFDRWSLELWRRLKNTSLLAILWASIDKTTASLADLPTRAHSLLTGILGADVTSTDTTKDKHISDADAKRWEDGLALVGSPSAQATFGGATGTLLNFADQGSTSYMVIWSTNMNPDGRVGDVWFEPISSTQARIYNSGAAGITFRYKVVP